MVFRTWYNPQRVLPRVKHWFTIKYVFKTKIHLKNMKFVANFEISESPLRGYLQRQSCRL